MMVLGKEKTKNNMKLDENTVYFSVDCFKYPQATIQNKRPMEDEIYE